MCIYVYIYIYRERPERGRERERDIERDFFTCTGELLSVPLFWLLGKPFSVPPFFGNLIFAAATSEKN